MKRVVLSMPEVALIAATRGLLGAGLGLLLAERLEPRQRRAVGWSLLMVGAISTIPLVAEVWSHRIDEADDESLVESVGHRNRMVARPR